MTAPFAANRWPGLAIPDWIRRFDLLPLALSDPRAGTAVERACRAYRIAYASGSLAGLTALVHAGQSRAVITQTAVARNLCILNGDPTLSPLPAIGITLGFERERPAHLTTVFAEYIKVTLPLL